MKKLYFLAKWDKKDITKTWSGSSYALYKGLSMYYDIVRLDFPDNMFIRFLRKISIKTKLFFLQRIIDYFIIKKINNQIKDDSIPVFHFGGINLPSPSFIYTDDLLTAKLAIINKCYNLDSLTKKISRFDQKMIEKEVKILTNAINIFCMGKWLLDFAQKLHPDLMEKFVEAPGGCNARVIPTDHFRDSYKRNKILFVGRDYRRKRLDLVLEAFKIVKKSRNNAVLLIAGPNENPLKNKISGVEFFGPISYERVGELMREADIFCMPSQYEAFGLVFIEALMSGVPCVARNQQEMKHFIQPGVTGALIETDSPAELSKKIIDVLNNDQIYNNVLANYNSYKSKYNWLSTCLLIKNHIDDYFEKR